MDEGEVIVGEGEIAAGEGEAAVDEGELSDGADDMIDDGTEELVKRDAPMVELILAWLGPMINSIVAGPRENIRDEVEQHSDEKP
ncbi:MAG: hypothetical protein ALECFALPRED_001345, partial [Alectoria fallacina]